MSKPAKNVLIGCTASVATIKLPILVEKLKAHGFNVKVIVTERAKHFFDPKELPQDVQLLTDEDEWKAWQKRGDPVVHIDLGKWADLMVIAPLDANSLAKISHGMCDNLLLCTVRAWDFTKPLLFCPAMNTRMYDHPLTSQQIDVLRSWGYIEVPSISKTLMCGDTGNGAMAEVGTIVEYIFKFLDDKRE